MPSKRIRIVILSTFLAGLALLFAGIPLIERHIETSLAVTELKNRIMASVKSSSAFALKIQGVRFSIIDGIIFSGVELTLEKGQTIFSAENIILKLSLWKYLIGQDPLGEIFVPAGAVYPVRIHREREAIESTRIPVDLIENRLIRVQNLEVILPDSNRILRPVANLSITPSRDQARITGSVTSSLQQPAAQVEFHGDLHYVSRSRFFFRFAEISPELTRYALQNSVLFPDDFKTFTHYLKMQHEPASGLGSFDYEKGKLALNVTGQFEGLSLQYFRKERFSVRLADQAGQFRYNAGFSSLSQKADFFDFLIESTAFKLGVTYRSPEIDGLHDYEITLGLREEAELTLADLPARTKMEATARIGYKARQEIVPELSLKLDSFNVDLSPLEKNAPPLMISGQAIQKDGDLVSDFKGQALGFPFSLGGTGKITFDPISIDDQKLHAIWQKHDLKLVMRDVDYYQLVNFVGGLAESIYSAAMARNARRAEDSGPLWRTSFTDGRLYQMLLKNFNLDATLEMHAKSGSPFPPVVKGELGKTGASYQFSIPTADNDTSSLFLRYYGTFDATMPRHDLTFDLQLKENTHALRGTDLKPQTVTMNYQLTGSGWYPYDLIFWTQSNLNVTLHKIDLAGLGPARILLYSIGEPNRPAVADALSITRRTQAGSIDYTSIRIEAPGFAADGSASFESDGQGRMKLHYVYDNGTSNTRDSVQMRTTAEGRWIPDE